MSSPDKKALKIISEPFQPANFLKNLTTLPGVYRMFDAQGEILYVGKAKDLKKRVSSYFQKKHSSPKTTALVKHIHDIQVTVTQTENEALLLENNLIKELKPRYNILLRDDKSYPYIFLSTNDPFPRLTFHRGPQRQKGHYYGPYPSAGSVRESLNLLQKIFPIRQCEESFYRSRSRPCLQYQIKRCSAPCVDLVSQQQYLEEVEYAMLFLQGKNAQVIDTLVTKMEQASSQLDFEDAARYRDQIAHLRKLQEKQYVSSSSGGNADVIACVTDGNLACIQLFIIRGGRNLGNRSFFPKHTSGESESNILKAFITQHYLRLQGTNHQHVVPTEILVNHQITDGPILEELLTKQSGHNVRLDHRVRSERARWLTMATINANDGLQTQLVSKSSLLSRFESLQDALSLAEIPQRLECFDISHTQGEATVASCVVFDIEGPVKSDYRRFNIEGIVPGDDYAAIRQAVQRRYSRLKQGEGKIPDILFIDGGKGQLSQASDIISELQIPGVLLVGIAKGVERRAGEESLFMPGSSTPIVLGKASSALHLIQQIRDEAHRFAITGHRQRRAKSRKQSVLEQVEGVGAKRRQLLLKQFGGLQGVASAGFEDLKQVKGINQDLAQRIHDAFHKDK